MASLVVLVSAGVMAALSARLWWFADDWDYLLFRGTVPDLDRGVLAPHGDHWSSSVVLVNRALVAAFGLESYVPWGLVPIVMHVAIMGLTWSLLTRCGAGRWTATTLVVLVTTAGGAAEAFLWDATMNLLGSLLLGLIMVHLVIRRPEGLRLGLAWAAGVGALSFSGAGIPAVAFATITALALHGWRSGLSVGGVPAGAFVFWFIEHGRSGSQSTLSPVARYLDVPSYVATGLTDIVDSLTLVPGDGAVLILLVVAAAVARRVPTPLLAVAVGGGAAALLHLTLVGATRIDFGVEQASAGRYLYFIAVLLTPAMAIALDAVLRRGAATPLITATVCVIVLAGQALDGGAQWLRYTDIQEATRTPWRERVTALWEATDAGQRILSATPEDFLNADLDARVLVRPEIRTMLGTGPSSPFRRLEVESIFMVGISDRPHGLPRPKEVRPDTDMTGPRTSDPGCHDYLATHDGGVIEVVAGAGGAEVRVTGASGSVQTQLVRQASPSPVRSWPDTASERYVGTSATGTVLRIALPTAGPYTVCTT